MFLGRGCRQTESTFRLRVISPLAAKRDNLHLKDLKEKIL